MATTGKTTLIEVAVTPRVLVLAWLTGVGAALDWAELDCVATSAAPAVPPPPGVPEGASISQAMSATTMATTMIAVRICMARGRRRSRRHERPSAAAGCRTPRRVATSIVASIVTLLRYGLLPPGRFRQSDLRPSRPRRSHQGRRPEPSDLRGPPRAARRPPPGPTP